MWNCISILICKLYVKIGKFGLISAKFSAFWIAPLDSLSRKRHSLQKNPMYKDKNAYWWKVRALITSPPPLFRKLKIKREEDSGNFCAKKKFISKFYWSIGMLGRFIVIEKSDKMSRKLTGVGVDVGLGRNRLKVRVRRLT